MVAEVEYLGKALHNPERPFVAILGGAKVSDKINVIDRLLEKADAILIGGAMTYTFRLALGLPVGKSLVEPAKVDMAKAALEKAKARKVPFYLASDNMVGTPVNTGKLNKKGKPIFEIQNPRHNNSTSIPDNEEGMDIGPNTVKTYSEIILKAKTIFWNGPMGVFEDPRFAEGTFAIARAVGAATQAHGAKSIIGGGDSVKALNQCGLADKVTFMSTGGGASLEFLEGKVLPGVAVLTDK
jgi:phosphoglycerate kinase